jgi:hypothetical protein
MAITIHITKNNKRLTNRTCSDWAILQIFLSVCCRATNLCQLPDRKNDFEDLSGDLLDSFYLGELLIKPRAKPQFGYIFRV